jgi:P27 family predicted phage terminase small subunit
MGKINYKMPAYIQNKEVADYMKKVVKSLKDKKLYDETDTMILDTLAMNYNLMLEAYEHLMTEGMTSVDRYGRVIPNAYIEIKKTAENQLNKCIQQLGLSAKSRKQIKSDNDDNFDLEAMLND